ncbi:MAG: YtxH domain-containing protein [Actinomycetota bacterium]|nr:YtxH domain-containing protein [Actinomycetota bacterium]
MRFRLGLGMGFGIGYYLGARAGRERYDQLNDVIRRVKRSETFETATDRAKEVVDLGVERTKDMVDSKLGDSEGPDGAAAPPPPDDPLRRTTP